MALVCGGRGAKGHLYRRRVDEFLCVRSLILSISTSAHQSRCANLSAYLLQPARLRGRKSHYALYHKSEFLIRCDLYAEENLIDPDWLVGIHCRPNAARDGYRSAPVRQSGKSF